MDIKLNELIEKIKRDGIAATHAETARIKADAEAEAKRIVEEAKKEAAATISKAKEAIELDEKASIAALEQASRNLILAFKGEIQAILDNLMAKAVASSYSSEVIKEILPDLIKNWAGRHTDSITVLLSEEDLKKLDNASKAMIVSALKEGVEIRAIKRLHHGFHIVEKDGSVFYDFSAESVTAMLSAYLNPKLAEILKRTADR
ncbi:MAG: V-type ATP synthase subunit E [Dehalococcoidia bacterium]|nr:V-type ATP synthase subunit E [Dehalococcoidia bacterium]